MPRVRVQVPIDQSKQQVATAQPAEGFGVPRGWFSKNNVIGALVLVAVLALLVMLLNDRNQLKEQVNKLSTAQSAPQASDTEKYQEEIGKIVELPSGQTPSLIPVKDAQKLASENTFFKNAKDGDVVLLYVSQDKSVRAILYRPSTKKVVEATSSATIGTQPSRN